MTNPTQKLEAAIVAAGATKAPRITPADIENNIASEHYFTAENGVRGAAMLTEEGADLRGAFGVSVPLALELLTICVLVLRNGFIVTGESACSSPENFNAEIGRRIARENAVSKVWPLMGYELRSKLAAAPAATGLLCREDQLVDLLVSARAIAERRGADTNWEGFSKRVESFGIGAITAKTFRALPTDEA